ncbi:hypothetical protein B0H19DRAFT_1155227 [Mycena capillaripes]|nr:hypothetical protein B0H19DRAFT_1155227 [Mycena capillaripes]
MHGFLLIFIFSFLCLSSAAFSPCPSQCSVLAFARADNVCCHEDDTTGLETPLRTDVSTRSSSQDLNGFAGAPIDHETPCPPVPAGYWPISMEEIDEAARIGELLASEYAEEYAPESLSF